MSSTRVLSVGQCAADQWGISRAFQQHFGVAVEAVDTGEQALARLREGPYALVLVNRVLDADGTSGVKLIQQVKEDNALQTVPVMLVSNYPDAQREAVEAGALPGFGKAALGQAPMLARVKQYLGEIGDAVN